SYSALATALEAQGRREQAEPFRRRALALLSEGVGDNHPTTVTARVELAGNLQAGGHLPEAEMLLRAAARHSEAARPITRFGGLERASLSAGRPPWQALALCQARLGRAVEAWQAYENNLARGLLDDLTAGPLAPDESRRMSAVLAEIDRL